MKGKQAGKRISILGSPVDSLTLDQAAFRISALIRQGGCHQVVTANPEILYSAMHDDDLQAILGRAALVTADGIGVVWASSFLGEAVPERVTGIDLMGHLMASAAREGWTCAFIGGKPGIALSAARRLSEQYPGLAVAGCYHGYFSEQEERAILDDLRRLRPHLLFVGFGAPRQEKWIDRVLRFDLCEEGANGLVAIGVGGSFDVFSGTVKRAPLWIRRLHLEWLYRLAGQPSRLKRQVRLPLFMKAVFQQKWKRW
ncbi:WecB/TagA/CpsF family glycosyltransferase [Heliobacterium undosum]|uniref:WecB/TagA/CpsF family glycosyltransferase n=1 Tax=Heliomicrobium undosum TaxID=121734 RepID=A0A845L068_9FIRM|nr:WecB/TagA/CpsF family glycosyltransferase [Heliomicrobium undosum]MZP29533.1 WecB/TagA/CpsF family glycosyltransferase [Heliomicrobium undosum]